MLAMHDDTSHTHRGQSVYAFRSALCRSSADMHRAVTGAGSRKTGAVVAPLSCLRRKGSLDRPYLLRRRSLTVVVGDARGRLRVGGVPDLPISFTRKNASNILQHPDR